MNFLAIDALITARGLRANWGGEGSKIMSSLVWVAVKELK